MPVRLIVERPADAPRNGFGTATATAGAAGAMLGELAATAVGAANNGCEILGDVGGILAVVATS